MQQVLVSIIIPSRNEEKFIGTVLDNILSQDYPQNLLEVFVADGESDDGTVGIIRSYCESHQNIHLLKNPARIVPPALNLAIKSSRGEVIVRMDAHSIYPDNYISKLVHALYEYNVDNVGGVWITEPGADTAEAKAITIATSHPFGIGNARYRLGAEKPILTDTVPFGCYRRDVFDRIGLFDEQLVRNQDDEFNGRLIKSGGKILLVPDIHIRYFARPTVKKLAAMFYQYGFFKPLVNLKLGKPATMRQLFPPVLVVTLIILLLFSIFCKYSFYLFAVEISLYLSMVIYFSFRLGFKLNLTANLVKVFPAIHLSYGWGYLAGIVNFMLLKKHKSGRVREIKISR